MATTKKHPRDHTHSCALPGDAVAREFQLGPVGSVSAAGARPVPGSLRSGNQQKA